jgi:hypothetical protein
LARAGTFGEAEDKKESQKVYVRLMLDPSLISEAEQEYGLYYFNPGMDGTTGSVRAAGR